MAEIKSESVADFVPESVADFARNTQMMRLSPAQLAALLEGLDWSRVHVPRIMRPKAVQ